MRHRIYTKTEEHIYLIQQISTLKQQNERLKKQIEKIEDAMQEIYQSKRKYKNRYKQASQKLQILQTVHPNPNHLNMTSQQQQFPKDHKQINPNININSQSTRNTFLKGNRQYGINNNLMQDITQNTLQSMLSSRKSEFKELFRINNNQRDLQQISEELPQAKDVGRIFRVKSQQKVKSRGCGLQDLCQPKYVESCSHSKNMENQENCTSQVEHKKTEGYLSGNNDLRQAIWLLLNQLGSFLQTQNDQKLEQISNKYLQQQPFNLRQNLQQICSKLQQIQKSQHLPIPKTSPNQHNLYKDNIKIKSNSSTNNDRSTSGGKLDTSFLKTIEDIGKDLASWRIDYLCDQR